MEFSGADIRHLQLLEVIQYSWNVGLDAQHRGEDSATQRKPTLIQSQQLMKIDSPHTLLVLQTLVYNALHKLYLATHAGEFLLASSSGIIGCWSSLWIPGIAA